MQISNTQRLILSNQYQLMAKLDPENAINYSRLQTIVERGYTLQLNQLSQDFDCLSESDCQEVIDIMEMFHAMQVSASLHNDKARPAIDQRRLSFLGFDTHMESRYVHYVRFIITSEGRYTQFLKGGHDFNTHVPMIEKYRRMLSVWRDCPRPYHLCNNELENIINV
ncbi:YfbU family protein [Vibrio ostreicida]|uniref:UPF0304 protein QWZ16_11530 n=1 Tax=Vibrio ostreicida TaxID=526588 RepID=A0ABT8BVC2_9VIBR|nr:YfbU family protein [Vibrio ostreicida]MDN3610334.1 YfbU family protein [Vibrio ostreicida]NPD07652.1 YfbU family protein [Vibrio ostreicida]